MQSICLSSLEKLTDHELISLARNNDAEAFRILLERYDRLIKHDCKKYFLKGADKEDLLQEGKIGFFNAVINYKKEVGDFKAFSRLCIQRQLITAVKTANRQKHLSLNEAITLDGPISEKSGRTFYDKCESIQYNPEETYIRKEEFNMFFSDLMLNLTKFEAKVFEMYLQDLDHSTAADQMGVSYRGILNAMYRIRKKARILYEKAS